MKNHYPLFHFDHEPSFAELWDKCVEQIYDIDAFVNDLENLYTGLGISKKSRIIDVAAGAGFPAHQLLKKGYDITCTDASSDMIELFDIKAVQAGITQRCRRAFWLQLPDLFPEPQFDYLMCRGNSFIYSDGGWNSPKAPNRQRAIKNYTKTMHVFFDRIKSGGWIHVDKFPDCECDHRQKVAEIQIHAQPRENLIFYTHRNRERQIRRAEMIRESGKSSWSVPNISYDLPGPELEQIMTEVGLQNVQKVHLPKEKLFNTWIGQKP